MMALDNLDRTTAVSWCGQLSKDGRIGIFNGEASLERFETNSLGRNSVSVTLDGRLAAGFDHVVREEVRSLRSDSISLVRDWTEKGLQAPLALLATEDVERQLQSDFPSIDYRIRRSVLIWMDDEQLDSIVARNMSPPDFLARALATGIMANLQAKTEGRR